MKIFDFIYSVQFAAGFLAGILLFIIIIIINPHITTIFLLQDDCNVMLRQTCNTANLMINVTDMQSDALEKCYNISKYTLPRLTKLNCEKLL